MESKKSDKANIDNLRGVLVLLGLCLSLGFVWASFEWSTKVGKVEEFAEQASVDIEEEQVIQTDQSTPPPPPPPPPPKVADVLEIVDDEEEIEEEMVIEDAEVDEDTEINVEEDIEVVEEETETIFVVVENQPEFPGGLLELRKMVAKSIKYPSIARENDIQGKVFVRFVVTKTGAIGKVEILRGVHPLLDKEAIRVIKLLPKWKPGMQGGRNVDVWFTLPINFQLQ